MTKTYSVVVINDILLGGNMVIITSEGTEEIIRKDSMITPVDLTDILKIRNVTEYTLNIIGNDWRGNATIQTQ